MSGEIQKYEGVDGNIRIKTMDDLQRVSKMLGMSGYFSDAKDAAQCGVKVLAGSEMNIGAFSAMSGIHIIKGKLSIGANLMAAAVKRHPNYNYRVLSHDEKVCRIAFYERWDGKLEQVGVSEFTHEQAQAAGTQNLQKFARNMLFARAMSNGVKWYCPDVFDTAVYTPEELGVHVDGEGNVIEATVVESPTGNCMDWNEDDDGNLVEPAGPDIGDGDNIPATFQDPNPSKPVAKNTISAAQRKRLFKIADTYGWNESGIREIVKTYTGSESTSSIEKGEIYDSIIEALQAGKPSGSASRAIEELTHR